MMVYIFIAARQQDIATALRTAPRHFLQACVSTRTYHPKPERSQGGLPNRFVTVLEGVISGDRLHGVYPAGGDGRIGDDLFCRRLMQPRTKWQHRHYPDFSAGSLLRQ